MSCCLFCLDCTIAGHPHPKVISIGKPDQESISHAVSMPRFVLTTQSGESAQELRYGCSNVIVATGLFTPNVPTTIDGINLASLSFAVLVDVILLIFVVLMFSEHLRTDCILVCQDPVARNRNQLQKNKNQPAHAIGLATQRMVSLAFTVHSRCSSASSRVHDRPWAMRSFRVPPRTLKASKCLSLAPATVHLKQQIPWQSMLIMSALLLSCCSPLFVIFPC